jgi:hypothetical protein
MAMQGGVRRRGVGARTFPVGRLFAALSSCLFAAGCGSLPPTLTSLNSFNPLAQGRDINIAVESIDGPPREVAQKLVSDLNAEGAPLRIGLVGAEADASYRMRGYLATHTAGATTTVTWALDVYDSGLNRTVRLSGEERLAAGMGPAGKGAAKGSTANWAVADETLLRRIAHAGMDQLAGFMAAPPAPAPAPGPAAPVPAGPGSNTVASREDASDPAGPGFIGMPRVAEAATRR